MLDCLVIGAGPAGLTAAIYLARFHLQTLIVDAGRSRASLIPLTRNHAGFPGGVSGRVLLERMRKQTAEFGVRIQDGFVDKLEHRDGVFHASVGDSIIAARSVLLATGVTNCRPRMDEADHDAALAQGLIRYCPICDGFEVTDKRVAVIGFATHGYAEAVFLRMYTADVTLIAPDRTLGLTQAQRSHLMELGIAMQGGPYGSLERREHSIEVPLADKVLVFDAIYPALGSLIHSECATDVGAEATEDGRLLIDDHQRTSIMGLYAAGDVAKGLDQISHAMGEAGVAATTIRNDLAETAPLIRKAVPCPQSLGAAELPVGLRALALPLAF